MVASTRVSRPEKSSAARSWRRRSMRASDESLTTEKSLSLAAIDPDSMNHRSRSRLSRRIASSIRAGSGTSRTFTTSP